MLIIIKTRHFHSPINHWEQLFHRTLITGYFHLVNIAKFLRMGIFIEHQKQSFADIPQNRYSWKFCKLHKKALVLEFLFKKHAGWRLTTSLKKTSTHVFSCEVYETFKNTFSYRTPPIFASALPVAASVFFLKEVLFNSYFATLLWCTNNFFFSTHHLMYIKSNSFVYKFVVNCQIF